MTWQKTQYLENLLKDSTLSALFQRTQRGRSLLEHRGNMCVHPSAVTRLSLPPWGLSEAGRALSEASSGLKEPSSGPREHGTGLSEPSPGLIEPGPGFTEPGPGPTEPGTVLSEPSLA